MKKDLAELKRLKSLIIPADKSNNFYTVDVETYKTLRNNNVEKSYKLSSYRTVEQVDKISRNIAESLKLENRIQKHTTSECTFTLKDQKEHFVTRPECRLLNPAKNQLGIITKCKVEEINQEIR